jgi:hypothetical protein
MKPPPDRTATDHHKKILQFGTGANGEESLSKPSYTMGFVIRIKLEYVFA